MEIICLEPGQKAPDPSDRVTVSVEPSGKAGFEGIFQAGTVEAVTVYQADYDSEEDAYQAAIRWAEAKRIETLYVERPDAYPQAPPRP